MGRDTEFNFGANLGFPSDVDPATGEIVLCMGRIKCAHCGKVYGVCSEVETNLSQQENATMLPRAGNLPPASGNRQQRQRSGYTYITEQDLSKDKQLARVLAVKENDQKVSEGQRRFSDIIVKIAFKGETRLFGLKLNNPNLAILQEAFTQDENKWPDREFYLFLEEEEFSGRMFPRVEPVTAKKARG